MIARPAAGVLLLIGGLASTELPAQVLSGRIDDAHGRPIAFVHVFPTDSARNHLGTGTLTDTAGRYRLVVGAQRPTHIAARRLGYLAEVPRALAWGGAETLQVDIVLHALPYELPRVSVRPDACTGILDPGVSVEIQRLWDDALSAIAARESFQNEFTYRQRVTGHRSANGRRIPTDTAVVVVPPAPPLDLARAATPLIAISGTGRNARMSLWSPSVRLLLHEEFTDRYCAEALSAADSAGAMLLAMRERDRADSTVYVAWRMHFRAGFPGPVRITFDYFMRGNRIMRAEHVYEQFDLDGRRFPLDAETSMTSFDPRSGRASVDARSRLTYDDIRRVP